MRRSVRRPLAYGLAFALAAAGLVVVPASLAHAAVACEVTYTRTWDNGSGFGANLTIRNVGEPLSGWRLTFTWPGNQRVTNGWSATWSQTGRDVTATNASWNGNVATGASVGIGFNGSYTGTNTNPTVFAVNGVTCNGQPPPVAVVVTPAAVSVPERGSAVVAVRLSRQPSGPVTLTTNPVGGDPDITVCGGLPLVFTPENWNVPQNLTLCAAADADTTNGTRTFTIVGTGVTAATVTATEIDQNGVTPILVPSSVLVAEGASMSVSLRLSAQPAANLTFTSTAGPGDPDLTICGGAVLIFTAANWNVPQNITICAAEDPDTVNGTRTFFIASTGLTTATVTATEIDNDVAKVDNPYVGADGYVNPDWQDRVNTEAANHPVPLGDQMRAVGRQPTAVWLDRIAAITAGRGLAGHLDAALAQDAANGERPVVVTLVLYNLPNRYCPAPAGGELSVTGNGLSRYRAEFIDPIRNVLAQPRFANLRVAVVVEPGSLFTMITHAGSRPFATLRCIEAQQSAVYREGIRYAVGQLATAANSYLYLDISNSGWLGWPDNFNPAVTLYDQTIAAASGGPGYDKIHGFVTNTADYVAVEEIFLPDPMATRGGSPLIQSRFFDFNPRFDERDFATDLHAAFVARGCPHCGLLIDTSRNGWGGPDRPTGPGTSLDMNTYVNQSRIDRRLHRSGFCNQNGAGLGARPTAQTGIAGVDAFVWVKPPGESDGVSRPNILDEEDPFRTYDPMCDPTLRNRYEDEVGTNALPDAPHFGRWFPQQFEMLVRNAYPPVA